MDLKQLRHNLENYQNNSYSVITQKIIQNILKLFNKTPKREKYAVLAVLSDIMTKRDLRESGFTFSNTMFKTSKRKFNEVEIEDKLPYMPESKKKKDQSIIDIITEKLNQYSQESGRLRFNKPIYNLQESK